MVENAGLRDEGQGGAVAIRVLCGDGLVAGEGGVLLKTPIAVKRGNLVLRLPGKFVQLGGDRLFNRLRTLARVIGRDPVLES